MLERVFPSMQIVDLRQTTPKQIEPLLEEEARQWLDELHWDYRPSLSLIRRFLDTRSLAGRAALENGRAAGYGFYVLEEDKALLGGLFVARSYDSTALASQLLNAILSSLEEQPNIERIEAQLMPFGHALDPTLVEHHFRLYTRQFMLLPLSQAHLAGTASTANADAATGGIERRVERWHDRYFEPCARLIRSAYADHVDGEINEQYRSEQGAVKFLRNIIVLPGCGQFLPDASFVIRGTSSEGLIGAVLTSAVAPGVGHTTQICVLPGEQNRGLGRMLLEAAIGALRARRFHALSLTVTSANTRAVQIYERAGFSTLRTFAAAVRRT
jgi:ribosomal protein S18 acetylase RimI-like enzyme